MNNRRMSNTRLKYILAPFTLTLALTITSTTVAMPPHSQIADKIARGEISRPYYLQNRAKLLSQGLNSPAKRLPEKESVLGTYNALAILVEFSDKNSSVSAAEFDTLIFINRQGSVRHYYNEVSYSQLDIVAVNLPSSLGWQTAPQTYSYYCNGQNGLGAYPQNTQKLTEDLIDLVDAVVDFSAYDNDLDGYVDALIIVHAGPGAEYTGSDNDIWSHQWGIFPEMKDGVLISEYCIQPEYWQTPGDITCGVFCHELGHVFGLPDLYDTDNPRDAYGIGKWSLMSYGSWNGPLGMGDYPAHPDAWSRIQLGFTSYTNVASNFSGAVIPSVESGGNIYRLWSSGGIGDEYFLVENRQKTGYDSYLPSSGLLIWHIDEAQSGNDNQWYPGHTSSGHYLVALEQADGLYEMEKNSSAGNSGDPFPGSHGVVSFTPLTTPNSNSYSGENTYVAVTDISSSGATMTADFQVAFSADAEEEDDPILPEKISLSQNFPNPFNPSTNINIELNEGAEIQLEIFDILGRLIKTLADGYYPQGTVNLTWDGTNDSGQKAASGIYFYRLRTDDGEHIKKMTMLK